MIAEKKAMWRADLRAMMTDARESGLSAGSAEREQLRLENQKKEQEIERLREEIARLRS
ncbi:hypothetical protein AGMMS50212_06680 [Spirochaetia bacterium]|nr:hypothetical protein AGMMS50212_06680 [Spirochaetia bacterium]